jgi:hypothetical protein
MSGSGRVQAILDSSAADWSAVSLMDIRSCILSRIGRFQALRRSRDNAEGRQQTQAVADDLKRLFPALARKYAERGPADLDESIADLERKMSEPDRINPFDDIYLSALKNEQHKTSPKV